MVFDALNVSLVASDAISDALNSVGLAASEAGDDAGEAKIEFGSFESALEEVEDEALGVAVSNQVLANSIDEIGDEATGSAVEVGGLRAALSGLDDDADILSDTAVGLTGSLGPVRGRISSVAAVAGAASVPLAGLATSLGGVAAGAGAAAGGIGLLSFGGLQREAERMAATNEDLADSGEALEEIFANFGQEVKAATEPLQTAANTEFAFSGMEGFVELAGMASTSVASITPELQELASSVGGSALENAPAIFDELETTVVELQPALEGLGSVFDMLPGAIAFLREQGVQLAPALGDLALGFGRATAGAGALGVDLLSFVIPALTTTLNLLGFLGGVAAAVPDPLLAGAGAAVIAAAAMATYGGATGVAAAATGALTAALGALTAPITAPIAAIAALVGVTTAAISAFGLWDDILGGFLGVWNGIVGAVEFGINTFLGLYDALGLLGPILFPGVAALFALRDALGLVGDLLSWLGDIAGDVFGFIGSLIDAIVEKIDGIIGVIDDVTDALGLGSGGADIGGDAGEVDLGALEAGGGSDDSDDSGGGGSSGPPPAPPAPAGASSGGSTTNNYDFSGADFGGSGGGPTEVQEAVQEANREDRAREDGRSA